MLSEHVKGRLLEMSGCLARGSIEANPFYVSSSENACARCDYAGACGFAEGEGGEESRPRRKYTPEAVWNLLRKELGMEEPEGKEGDFNE